MSKQDIVERILFDANAVAAELVAAAQRRADVILTEAQTRAETVQRNTEAEAAAYERDVKEKRAAAARLDSAKALLAEQRKVLDYLYVEALRRLKTLSKEDLLALIERLLETYADDEDEMVLAEGFAFENEVRALPVFKAKRLHMSEQRAEIEGGFLLRGIRSDKDLSFEALSALDKEAHLAEIAAQIF